MKKLLFILLSVFVLTSCGREDLTLIDTEVIEGKVSYIQNVRNIATHSTIYVQTPTETVSVLVPASFASKYKIGDYFVVVIKKIIKTNK